MIVFAIKLNKHSKWCGTATKYNTRTNRPLIHLWQLVPNDVNSDQEQSTKAIIPHAADDARTWRHSIETVAILLVF